MTQPESDGEDNSHPKSPTTFGICHFGQLIASRVRTSLTGLKGCITYSLATRIGAQTNWLNLAANSHFATIPSSGTHYQLQLPSCLRPACLLGERAFGL